VGARKTVGLLVIDGRKLVRKALAYVAGVPGDDLPPALRCIAAAQVRREWLRGRPPGDDSVRYLAAEERSILKSNWEDRVVGLTVAVGVLERIKVTPMPFAYTLLIHRTACLFCFCRRSRRRTLRTRRWRGSSFLAGSTVIVAAWALYGERRCKNYRAA
jgi:ion channel-forming bestrophin family protein